VHITTQPNQPQMTQTNHSWQTGFSVLHSTPRISALPTFEGNSLFPNIYLQPL